jgi:hypothetical protein
MQAGVSRPSNETVVTAAIYVSVWEHHRFHVQHRLYAEF